MPYRKITFSDGTETSISRVDWRNIAACIPANILADAQSALRGSDGGKWTVFTATTHSGLKLHISNGKKVLEDS